MTDDRNLAVPATLRVAFPRSDGETAAYVLTYALPALSPAGWAGATGRPEPTTLYAALVYDGTNATALSALGRQMALDWLAWRRGRAHLAFIGTVPWVPEGHSDVEWEASAGTITTRATSTPLDVPRGLTPPGCCAVEECCGTTCYEFFDITGPALAYVSPDNVWTVLDLDTDGTLTVTGGVLAITP